MLSLGGWRASSHLRNRALMALAGLNPALRDGGPSTGSGRTALAFTAAVRRPPWRALVRLSRVPHQRPVSDGAPRFAPESPVHHRAPRSRVRTARLCLLYTS